MVRYVLVSIFGGIVFGFMDGIIHANPAAQKLFEVYKPIAKASINVPLGVGIDLVYGFVMAGVFLVLYKSLPGKTGAVKGLSYGLIMWFFRVAMYTLTQYMMFTVSPNVLLYTAGAGLIEMLILGLFFGLTLKK